MERREDGVPMRQHTAGFAVEPGGGGAYRSRGNSNRATDTSVLRAFFVSIISFGRRDRPLPPTSSGAWANPSWKPRRTPAIFAASRAGRFANQNASTCNGSNAYFRIRERPLLDVFDLTHLLRFSSRSQPPNEPTSSATASPLTIRKPRPWSAMHDSIATRSLRGARPLPGRLVADSGSSQDSVCALRSHT